VVLVAATAIALATTGGGHDHPAAAGTATDKGSSATSSPATGGSAISPSTQIPGTELAGTYTQTFTLTSVSGPLAATYGSNIGKKTTRTVTIAAANCAPQQLDGCTLTLSAPGLTTSTVAYAAGGWSYNNQGTERCFAVNSSITGEVNSTYNVHGQFTATGPEATHTLTGTETNTYTGCAHSGPLPGQETFSVLYTRTAQSTTTSSVSTS
jgi:hypothetical protein